MVPIPTRMQHPWLSVLMPTYNGATFLKEALDSIVAQESRDIEVVAVDDGSTDSTLEILRSYAGRLPLRIEQPGRVGNWITNTNRALRLARGEFACFLHQDDLWMRDRLSTLRRTLDAHPDATLVLHSCWFIDAVGRRLGQLRPHLRCGRIARQLVVHSGIPSPVPTFRREAALRVDGLDERLWYTGDWDLWIRLAASGKTVVVPQALAANRLHRAQQTWRRSGEHAEFRRQHELVIAKHRALLDDGTAILAELSIEVNAALAVLANGRMPAIGALASRLFRAGPFGIARYLSASRLHERVLARLKATIRA